MSDLHIARVVASPPPRAEVSQSNTPALDALIKTINLDPRKSGSLVNLMEPATFTKMFDRALCEDLAGVSQQRGAPVEEIVRQALQNAGMTKDDVRPTDLPGIRQWVIDLKTVKPWTALDKTPLQWFRDNVAAFEAKRQAAQRAGRNFGCATAAFRSDFEGVLAAVIEQNFPDNSSDVRSWVRATLFEQVGGPPHDPRLTYVDRLARELENVTQWYRKKTDPRVPNRGFKLRDKEDTYELGRHWRAHLKLEILKSRVSSPEGVDREGAIQLIADALQELMPPNVGSEEYPHEVDRLNREAEWIFDHVSMNFAARTAVLISKRLQQAGINSSYHQVREVIIPVFQQCDAAQSLAPLQTYFTSLQSMYGIDVSDLISTTDFARADKIDTLHKVEWASELTYNAAVRLEYGPFAQG